MLCQAGHGGHAAHGMLAQQQTWPQPQSPVRPYKSDGVLTYGLRPAQLEKMAILEYDPTGHNMDPRISHFRTDRSLRKGPGTPAFSLYPAFHAEHMLSAT